MSIREKFSIELLFLGIFQCVVYAVLVVVVVFANLLTCRAWAQSGEAAAGFDDLSNGFESQEDFKTLREAFEETENIGDGLGPFYNSTSCVSCHQNPITGGPSQVSVVRAGHFDSVKNVFVEPAGGSLIFQRAIDPAIQAHVPPGNEITSLRMATSILGNGFVECIAHSEIFRVQQSQPRSMQGAILLVPVVVDSNGSGGFNFTERVGRFGWKCQDASLMNFSAGAYLNEMGITSPMQPKENSSNGRDVSLYDKVADPEDKTSDKDQPGKTLPFGKDVTLFARFMRSTKAPPQDPTGIAPETLTRGKKLFATLGCAVCHVPDWTTVPKGTKIGDFEVPAALGDKTLHPYSDFMLHDIGSGDGIVQTQHAQRPAIGSHTASKGSNVKEGDNVYRVSNELEESNVEASRQLRTVLVNTANMMRTAPLWGLRTRPQLMHDGLSLSVDRAIRRHGNQAYEAKHRYVTMTQKDRDDLLAFLSSL